MATAIPKTGTTVALFVCKGESMSDPQGEREQLEWYAQFVSRSAAKELQENELWVEQCDLDITIDDTGAQLTDPHHSNEPVGPGITRDRMVSVLKAFLAGRAHAGFPEEEGG
jgi:hypothetical protein